MALKQDIEVFVSVVRFATEEATSTPPNVALALFSRRPDHQRPQMGRNVQC
jgi:hypothetical protein